LEGYELTTSEYVRFAHRENDIDFLSFRLWIGVWVSLFLLTAVALDLSALIRYITRFTEESFAVLISVIFIYQSVVSVADIWTTHPLRSAAAATVEPCYCGRDKTVTSAYVDEDRGQRLAAAVTVRLGRTAPNNSVYRYCTSHGFSRTPLWARFIGRVHARWAYAAAVIYITHWSILRFLAPCRGNSCTLHQWGRNSLHGD